MKPILLAALLFPLTASAAVSDAYKSYASKCQAEVKAAGKDGVACLRVAEFAQVEGAIPEIAKVPGYEAAAKHISKWLEGGFILADTSLGSGTSGETRRDGTSRPMTSPQAVSDNVSLDGNVYLNTTRPILFVLPADVKKAKADLAKLQSKAGEPDAKRKRAIADLELRADVASKALFLQSVLVHEDVHTGQAYGNKNSKEGGAYDAQIAYLTALRGSAPAASTQAARLDALIAAARLDRAENVH